jgi:hypothetical protein
MAARSEAWTVFALSNIGVVGSNPTQSMGVCLCLFCVCVGSPPCDGLNSRPRSPTDCLRLAIHGRHFTVEVDCKKVKKKKRKVKLSLYSPWRPVGLREVDASTFFWHSAHRWRQGCQPYAPAAIYPDEDSWYSFLLEAESGTRTGDLPACSIVSQPTTLPRAPPPPPQVDLQFVNAACRLHFVVLTTATLSVKQWISKKHCCVGDEGRQCSQGHVVRVVGTTVPEQSASRRGSTENELQSSITTAETRLRSPMPSVYSGP